MMERWPTDARLPSNRRAAVTQLWERDGGICQICGCPVDLDLRFPHPSAATVDHVVPMRRYEGTKDKGHLDVWGNTRLAHNFCNLMQADRAEGLIAVGDYREARERAEMVLEMGIRPRAPLASTDPELVRKLRLGVPLHSASWVEEQWRGRPTGSQGQIWDFPEELPQLVRKAADDLPSYWALLPSDELLQIEKSLLKLIEEAMSAAEGALEGAKYSLSMATRLKPEARVMVKFQQARVDRVGALMAAQRSAVSRLVRERRREQKEAREANNASDVAAKTMGS